MKQDIFYRFVDQITHRFDITKEELYSKTKKQEVSDARHMLYFTAKKRGIPTPWIQKYMALNGYETSYNTIHAGIKKIEKLIKDDQDYHHVADEISECIN